MRGTTRMYLDLRLSRGPKQYVWTSDIKRAYAFLSVRDAAETARNLGAAVYYEATQIAMIRGKVYIVKDVLE